MTAQPERPRSDPIREMIGEGDPSGTGVPKRTPPHETAAGTPEAPHSAVTDVSLKRPVTILQLLGPGLITGASDDDPSGIGTYSQVGSQFGYGLLWTALFTFPLMAAVQELCGRIALQTGVGLGLSLRRKFPTWLVGLCILALVIANTVNVGADLGAIAVGGSLLTHRAIGSGWLVIPAALLIVTLQLWVAYTTIFRIFKWLTLALFAYVATAFFAHPNGGAVLVGTLVPQIQLNAAFITAIVAILGTTISPYLFFWQASSEVDEMKAAGLHSEAARRGVKLSELKAARLDIFTGMFFSNIVMYFIILTSAAVLHAHGKTSIQSADQAASALAPFAGQYAFLLFASGMIGTGLLAVPILSGSAAYALKEFLHLPGDLASKPRYTPTFYLIIVAATLVGVAINYLGINPIQALVMTAVINGVVAPPLLVLIILLGSDRSLMQARVSGPLSRIVTWVAAATMTGGAICLLGTMIPGIGR